MKFLPVLLAVFLAGCALSPAARVLGAIGGFGPIPWDTAEERQQSRTNAAEWELHREGKPATSPNP